MISPKFELTGVEAKGLLFGLLEVNKEQLRQHPNYPSMRELIRTGKVRYEASDPDEHWQSYREMVEAVQRNGIALADCEDLASAVAAEDQVRYGIMSIPYAYRPKENLFHVVVQSPMSAQYSGVPFPKAVRAPAVPGYGLEDPSIAAGMKVAFGGMVGKPDHHFHRQAAKTRSRFGGLSDTEEPSYVDSLLGRAPKGRPLGTWGYEGVLSHLVTTSSDMLVEPLNDDEEEAVSEMAILESFGRAAKPKPRSKNSLLRHGSHSSQMRPEVSFGSMPVMGRESFDSDEESVSALVEGLEGEEDPMEEAFTEFIEDRL